MPEPFIVPTVCQYTVHGTYQGRNVANVLAYHIDTTGSTLDRPSACFQMGGILLNEWDDSILPLSNSSYSATSVSWIDLNSDDGTVGSRTVSGGHSWPKAGGSVNASMPGNVALLVRKNVSGQRGAKRGRMYLCGVDETATLNPDANHLMPNQIAPWQTKLDSFLGDTNQANQGTASYSSQMVVIHITDWQPDKNGKPKALPLRGIGLTVTSLSLDSLLATQRRRLRG